jgi:tetratricopeptide (TPR) repeat protein
MPGDTCEAFAPEELSAHLDGDLSPARAAAVKAHVAGCAVCTKELAAIAALRSALASAPPPPPPSLDAGWAALSAALADEKARRPRRFAWVRRILAVRLGPLPLRLGPTLAACAVALAVVGGMRLRRPAPIPSDDAIIAQAEDEFRLAEAHYQRALERLTTIAERSRPAWSAERRAAFDSARAELESAVESCRKVAHANPADGAAQELLFAAYRKQIAFVEDALFTDDVGDGSARAPRPHRRGAR